MVAVLGALLVVAMVGIVFEMFIACRFRGHVVRRKHGETVWVDYCGRCYKVLGDSLHVR